MFGGLRARKVTKTLISRLALGERRHKGRLQVWCNRSPIGLGKPWTGCRAFLHQDWTISASPPLKPWCPAACTCTRERWRTVQCRAWRLRATSSRHRGRGCESGHPRIRGQQERFQRGARALQTRTDERAGGERHLARRDLGAAPQRCQRTTCAPRAETRARQAPGSRGKLFMPMGWRDNGDGTRRLLSCASVVSLFGTKRPLMAGMCRANDLRRRGTHRHQSLMPIGRSERIRTSGP